MRRLPVYAMVDVSETMAGPALEALQGGLSTMMAALRRDPMVIETGAVSIIAFGADAEVLVPLSDVTSVQIPELHISSGTSLGKAFRKLLRQIAKLFSADHLFALKLQIILHKLRIEDPLHQSRLSISLFSDDHGFISGI